MSQQKASLDGLFQPRSIAVVGASTSPEKPGYQMVLALKDFSGPLYPINPKADEVLGHKCYPSLTAIGEQVDLIILCVPAPASPAVLEEAGQIGARGALIISGGFAEVGDEKGAALQEATRKACEDNGIRLLGPNTSGFVNTAANCSVSFAPGVDQLEKGDIAVVAQSGGVNLTLAFLIKHLGLGVSFAIGLGNAIDVDAADAVDYLADDEGTKAIALHLEGIADGRRLYEAVKRATAKKPVVAITVGRADIGAFAQSHTGNLIGSYELKLAALRQAGAVVVETPSDVADAVSVLSRYRLPAKAEPGAALLTGQAGPGLIILDQLKSAGVDVPTLGEDTVAKIGELLPPMTYIKNPVDTGRPSPTFKDILQILDNEPAIDANLIFALHEPAAVDAVELFEGIAGKANKPILFGTIGVPEAIGPSCDKINQLGVPAFGSPEAAAKALAALVADAKMAHRKSRYSNEDQSAPLPALPEGALDEEQAKAAIQAAGFKVPGARACKDRSEAYAAFTELNKPVVVKVLCPEITHKTDVGGVHLNINSEQELITALDTIDAIPVDAKKDYLIEEMALPGLDLIIGGIRDNSFGPVVMLGLGGTQAEAIKDVSMRLAPLERADAEEMLNELKGKALLDGWRGEPAVDKNAIIDALIATSRLMLGQPSIKELDINPLRAYPDGAVALDSLIVK